MRLGRGLHLRTLPARLRLVAFVEGLSYLALLFVAMPLKYGLDLPQAVRLVGAAHGVLFLALGLLTLQCMLELKKSLGWGLRVGLLSLVPFGTFFLDSELDADDRRAEANEAP